MQNLKIFNHAEFGQVRTVTKSGEIWFVGKDVADALGYSQTAKAIRDHVKDTHKGVSEMDTPGGRQSLVIKLDLVIIHTSDNLKNVIGVI